MIIDHEHPAYISRWEHSGMNRHNGAFYYSIEIVKNIIPNVETDRNWVTVNIPFFALSHSIVFIHNNKYPQHYDWLSRFDDLVLVCGIPETCEKVKHLGTPIYLPLSIDVNEVLNYKTEKTKGTAYAGRQGKRRFHSFGDSVDLLEALPREELLKKMAEYRNIFAVGRTAIEAKCLGCNIFPYDERFPDVGRWKVLDNRDAAEILQKKLNEIDGRI